MTAERVTWEFPPLPTWAGALLGESVSRPEAEVRRALGMPPADVDATLAAVDAAVEGRCAGPACTEALTENSPSAWYCSAGCQERYLRQQTTDPDTVDGSEYVDAPEMRWRPDLVTAFDDSGLELVEEITGGGRTRRWYHAADGRRFLRLDDGHRFVGAWAPEDGPADELWRRLERELTDQRRLGPEHGQPDGTGALGEGVVPPTGLSAEQMRATICEWLRANDIDPDLVPADAQIEVRDGRIHCEMVHEATPDGPLCRHQVSVRHRCRPPWPGTGPCPNCVERCAPGCGCTCWGPQAGSLASRLGDPVEFATGQAAAHAELAAAGTLLWLPDRPADPERPTSAELAGGIDLTPYLAPAGARPTATWVDETREFVDTVPAERSVADERFRRVEFGPIGAGPFAETVRRAAQAESDRMALRAVCVREAMYERALAAAGERGWSVGQMADAVAAGRYTEEGWDDLDRMARASGATWQQIIAAQQSAQAGGTS